MQGATCSHTHEVEPANWQRLLAQSKGVQAEGGGCHCHCHCHHHCHTTTQIEQPMALLVVAEGGIIGNYFQACMSVAEIERAQVAFASYMVGSCLRAWPCGLTRWSEAINTVKQLHVWPSTPRGHYGPVFYDICFFGPVHRGVAHDCSSLAIFLGCTRKQGRTPCRKCGKHVPCMA